MLSNIWHYVRWPLAVLAVAYVALVIYRIPTVGEKERTEKTVAKIHAQKITLSDVMGDVLPPVPNIEENNATVEGIDANNNGIRDDVELAIFDLHPDSAKIRAAQLQYAMAQQRYLTDVFNSETWKAVAEEDSRGYACISALYPRDNMSEHTKMLNERVKETEDLVFNTELRVAAKDEAYEFTTSFGLPNSDFCNIDLDSLPN